VTVVIPVYNGAAYVAQAVESVLAQSLPPAACVVVDDGSDDRTPQVLETYAQRVRVVRTDNGGVARARNLGARGATTTWLAFLDADDVWLPTRLERQLELVEPGVALAYCGLLVTDEALRPRRRMGVPSATQALPNALLLESPPVSVAQAALVDRLVFDDVGGFDEAMSTSADADLVVRIAARHRLQALDDDLVLYRQHDGQMSSNPVALERDMRRLHGKAFGTGLLGPDAERLRRRARANLHASLAAEWSSRGDRAAAVRHAATAVAADPARVASLVSRRVARLLRRPA
jgi:glycosyltransferase involved in cell wall biosynthesis